ncbi:hypothetical protein C4D60_Mb04t24990 [Musa balbisiana]|uniref:Uncharacterized protein n=1 Tax=Musa balbisiana TaxID=52838 RepID=A0A4S8KEM1_MUSBA|nr:hypothetical protein C4D60_Mb04t24990 [Musa balbisiana]
MYKSLGWVRLPNIRPVDLSGRIWKECDPPRLPALFLKIKGARQNRRLRVYYKTPRTQRCFFVHLLPFSQIREIFHTKWKHKNLNPKSHGQLIKPWPHAERRNRRKLAFWRI